MSKPSQHDSCAKTDSLMPKGQHHQVNCGINFNTLPKSLWYLVSINASGSYYEHWCPTQRWNASTRSHPVDCCFIVTVAYSSFTLQHKYWNEPHLIPLSISQQFYPHPRDRTIFQPWTSMQKISRMARYLYLLLPGTTYVSDTTNYNWHSPEIPIIRNHSDWALYRR